MQRALQNAATSLVLMLVIAFGVRVTFAWDQARRIPTDVLGTVPFENETGNVAAALATGQGFSSVFRQATGPTAWLTPVYPLLVAGVFRIFGVFTVRSFFAIVFLNIVFSTAACVPIFYAGKRLAGLGVASGAVWLWALFPNAIMIPFEWVWDTSLSALLAATLLWATLEAATSQRLRDWCAYGLLWGLSLLSNPALGALLPLLLGWAAYRAHPRRALRLGRPALAAGIVILCCLPWTIRNYAVFHRFIPLRSNLPFELWLGNNEIFDPHSANVMARITRYEQIHRYTQLGETSFMEEKWQKATHFMRTHPGLEVRLFCRRFVATWVGTETPVKTFLHPDSLLVRVVLLANILAAIGVLAGIVVLFRRRSRFAFPVAAFPLVFPCLYYVTHTSLRYRHPIDPIVLLLTAISVAALYGALVPHIRKQFRAA